MKDRRRLRWPWRGIAPMAKDELKRATRIRAARLLAAVKDVIGAVATKDTIPILSHVVIAAHDGLIHLSATDLDMQSERVCASDDRDGPGSAEWIASIAPFALAVPGKAFVAVLSGFDPDAMVTLAVEGSRLSIAAGRSRFRLSALAAADMPMLPRFDLGHEFEIGAALGGQPPQPCLDVGWAQVRGTRVTGGPIQVRLSMSSRAASR